MPAQNSPTSAASPPDGETPVTIAHYLGLTPKWVDGTAVGGCSFMIHVRHAVAAIESGLCEKVLITQGESDRSGVGRTRNVVAPTSLAGQFEQPYGPMGPPTLFTIPVLRYMKTCGLTHEQLAMVSVVQREWASKNPRATFKTPITVEDVLNSRMIAYPFRLLQCCLITDGGDALILAVVECQQLFRHIGGGGYPWQKWVPACERVRELKDGCVGTVCPPPSRGQALRDSRVAASSGPARRRPGMRWFLNAINNVRHGEERRRRVSNHARRPCRARLSFRDQFLHTLLRGKTSKRANPIAGHRRKGGNADGGFQASSRERTTFMRLARSSVLSSPRLSMMWAKANSCCSGAGVLRYTVSPS